jgi:hypothetical protein
MLRIQRINISAEHFELFFAEEFVIDGYFDSPYPYEGQHSEGRIYEAKGASSSGRMQC